MIETILSMLLTFAWMWHGRDREVYAPTFKGTRVERYEKAVHHFRARMGLPGTATFDVRPEHPFFCSWVNLDPPNPAYVYGLADPATKGCKPRPEILAFHEVCHERYAHVGSDLTREQKHAQVKSCMKAYSEPSRR